MSSLPIVARLLLAARQAYEIEAPGPVSSGAPYDEIGWLSAPTGFATGAERIDAALIGQTASETIVAFRGTLPPTPDSPDKRQVLLDWLSDFDAIPVHGDNLPGLVHQGFLDALNALWPDVADEVRSDKPIYFTGHSKGGALACLAAARWTAENIGKTPPFVTTFAAAKPGDADFQVAYDKLVPHSLRYEYQDDIVPHLPPGVEFRAMFAKVPLFRDFIANSNAKLPEGAVGFVGVGDLKFIDWSDAIVEDSLPLRFQRYAHLIGLVVELNFERIIADHSLDDGGGYATAILPTA
ncbi:MAG: lipase family protein [Roseiarcus sp.]|jgi:hypothetical protein